MKRALLINPQFNIAKENYDSSISVGLLSIASYLDSKGIGVKIVDCVRETNYLKKIRKYARSTDYVGISVMTTQLSNALRLSKLVKKVNPSCRVVWGGPHATFFKEQCVESKFVDMVCVGEGEETFYEIVNGVDPEKILGIVYKKDGDIKKTSARPLHDPTKMPLFNWDLIAPEVLYNLKLVPTLTSRGCPHICSFCINAILKLKWRQRTAEQVLVDLEVIKSKTYFKGKKLRFWDENFFVDIKRAKTIVKGMIERNLITPWETTVRANYIRDGMIDNAFLKDIKQSGCYLLSFGAESGCPRILKK
ncbi:MAG: hypothetical protein GF349_01930 [Candidatus Magasanikbacteria bacterium]|nr:hypothetical protein [Candidatus Magasanikbacteria bacterium]